MQKTIQFFSAFVLSTFIVSYVNAQNTIVVEKNKTYDLKPTQNVLQLKQLTLEDGATLRIDPSVQHFTLNAARANIGHNARIISTGASGDNGDSGASSTEKASACQPGTNGQDATNGLDGQDGLNLSLNLALIRYGSLKIDLTGGNGGNGGTGGNGSDASQKDNCDRERGGAGGSGGAGGQGGDGGSLFFQYSFASSNQSFNVEPNTTVLTSAGEGGTGGAAGAGGEGTKGYYSNRRTLAGNRKWNAGGKPGDAGDTGINGELGNEGRIQFQFIGAENRGTVITRPLETVKLPVDPIVPPKSNKKQTDTIQQLIERIEKLEKRIEKLEADK